MLGTDILNSWTFFEVCPPALSPTSPEQLPGQDSIERAAKDGHIFRLPEATHTREALDVQ
jgi:hypothetical protein